MIPTQIAVVAAITPGITLLGILIASRRASSTRLYDADQCFREREAERLGVFQSDIINHGEEL